MYNVNRIQLLLCATLLIHWTSASPSSRFNAQISAQNGHGSMAGEVRNLQILRIKLMNSEKATKITKNHPLWI